MLRNGSTPSEQGFFSTSADRRSVAGWFNTRRSAARPRRFRRRRRLLPPPARLAVAGGCGRPARPPGGGGGERCHSCGGCSPPVCRALVEYLAGEHEGCPAREKLEQRLAPVPARGRPGRGYGVLPCGVVGVHRVHACGGRLGSRPCVPRADCRAEAGRARIAPGQTMPGWAARAGQGGQLRNPASPVRRRVPSLRVGRDYSGDAVEEAAVSGTSPTRGPDAGTPRSRCCAVGGSPLSVREVGQAVGVAPVPLVAHQLIALERRGVPAPRSAPPPDLRGRSLGRVFGQSASSTSRPAASCVPLADRIAAGGPVVLPYLEPWSGGQPHDLFHSFNAIVRKARAL